MRGSVRDKVLEPICGVPAIMRSFGAFVESGRVSRAVFVCRDGAQRNAVERLGPENFTWVAGSKSCFAAWPGARRQTACSTACCASAAGTGSFSYTTGQAPRGRGKHSPALGRRAPRRGGGFGGARFRHDKKAFRRHWRFAREDSRRPRQALPLGDADPAGFPAFGNPGRRTRKSPLAAGTSPTTSQRRTPRA